MCGDEVALRHDSPPVSDFLQRRSERPTVRERSLSGELRTRSFERHASLVLPDLKDSLALFRGQFRSRQFCNLIYLLFDRLRVADFLNECWNDSLNRRLGEIPSARELQHGQLMPL